MDKGVDSVDSISVVLDNIIYNTWLIKMLNDVMPLVTAIGALSMVECKDVSKS